MILSMLLGTVPAAEASQQDIVITAEREPVAQSEAHASASVIDRAEIDAIGTPMAADLLRLTPGVSVATSGPQGSQVQVRIRGAEANHTLLFIDGIRFNDPAAANEARFELLSTDSLTHIEVVRGPQSALWGSEALGGVVAAETLDPLGSRLLAGRAEYGSLGFGRAAAEFSIRAAELGLAGGGSWMRSDGIDAFGAAGDRDGFSTRSANLKGTWAMTPRVKMNSVFHYVAGTSQFDGFDALTGAHADTADSTKNRIAAGRLSADIALASRGNWRLSLGAGVLDSSNRNRNAGVLLNRTAGRRSSFDAELSGRLQTGGSAHRLTVAVSREDEDFKARDENYFGATDQDRSRSQTAIAAEVHSDWLPSLSTDVALRHDRFSAFDDATTLRAGLNFKFSPHWRAHAAYGKGIAQPSFYELFGFFPGMFVGNPGLKPERSTGWEAGLGWSDGGANMNLTGFKSRLKDELIDVFDPITFISSAANADGVSRRQGFEFDGEYRLGAAGVVRFNYTFLDAEEQRTRADDQLREVRRPRHSANAAAYTSFGPANIGAGVAYVGKRYDTNFDIFPAQRVRLHSYVLASLNAAVRIQRRLEVYGRIENAFGADYEDAVGYATPGRTVYAGIRMRLGD